MDWVDPFQQQCLNKPDLPPCETSVWESVRQMGTDTEASPKQRGRERGGETADSLTRDTDCILYMMF